MFSPEGKPELERTVERIFREEINQGRDKRGIRKEEFSLVKNM